jgi:D-alanine-D-alanine ligase
MSASPANPTSGPLSGRRVAVLMGGPSPEREVSLVTGRACASALERLGATVLPVDSHRDVAARLAEARPDVIFNALHGEWGEDGRVQGVLDAFGVPYTHSGVLASALAMDKDKAKAVLRAAGVTVPGGGLFDRRAAARDHVLPPPYVVKPNAQGSSVGVFIVREGANRPPVELTQADWSFGEQVLIEPYIRGLELAVAVMGAPGEERALAVTEIVEGEGFYDYEAKYGANAVPHVLPARIPGEIAERAKAEAVTAHRALGCRGLTRSDFRYDDLNRLLVLLEVNTQPGMTPTSLAPEQAAHVGMDFDQLVLWITEDASCPR